MVFHIQASLETPQDAVRSALHWQSRWLPIAHLAGPNGQAASVGHVTRRPTTTVHILLVDDHVLFRDGLAMLLGPLRPGLLTSHAGSVEEALSLVDVGPAPDMVLMDLGLPGMHGLDGIALLRQQQPALPVVALSSADDRDTVLQAIEAGAMGFIPKSSTSAVMLAALQLILARGVYLPPSVLSGGSAPPPAVPSAQPTSAEPLSDAASRLGLTPRQCEVLLLILQGKPAKLIERDLGLSASSVKAHTSAVLRALNVTTRTQAVVAAGRLGLRFS
jgi:DNA-binding NarL/FixJ family response regulator